MLRWLLFPLWFIMGIEFRPNASDDIESQLQNDEIQSMADEIQTANETQDATATTNAAAAAAAATSGGTAYTVGDEAFWEVPGTTPLPTTVEEAINRIAAVVGSSTRIP